MYRTRTHSRTEERLRRKMLRQMISELPGKLDHASVVAYKVGRWYGTINSNLISNKEDLKLENNASSLLEILKTKENVILNKISDKLQMEEKKDLEVKKDLSVSLNCNLKRNYQKADATKVNIF